MGTIRIGGVHGVGKSTLIEKALKISGKKAPIIKGAEIMSDYLKKSPEEFPFISKEARNDARKYMLKS